MHRKKLNLAVGTGLLILLAGSLVFAALLDANEFAILLRTIGVGAISGAFAIAFSVPLLMVIRTRDRSSRFRSAVIWCLVPLALLPPYLTVGYWDAAFGKMGWLTSSQDQSLRPLFSGYSAAVWVYAMSLTPQLTLLMLFTVGRRKQYEDQASLEASPWAVIWSLTLPRWSPAIAACLIWSTIVCAREIDVSDLYQIGTLAEHIYLGYATGIGNLSGDLENATAPAWQLHVAVMSFLCLLAGTAILLFPWGALSNALSQEAEASRFRSPRSRQTCWTLAAVLVLVLLITIPAVNVISNVGLQIVSTEQTARMTWSWSNAANAITKVSGDHADAFGWSAIIASLTATALVLLLLPTIWWARGSRTAAALLPLVLIVACGISGPGIGQFVSQCFAAASWPLAQWIYDRTVFPAVLAGAVFALPLSAIGIWLIVRAISFEITDHAATEGLGHWRQFAEFVVHSNRSRIGGVWLLIFAFCFGEISATSAVVPPGVETIGQVVLGKLHAGVDESTAALTILLTTAVIVLVIMGGWMIAASARRNRV